MERQGLIDTVQLPSGGNGRQLARREAGQLVKKRENSKTNKTVLGSVYYALSVRPNPPVKGSCGEQQQWVTGDGLLMTVQYE